MRLFYFLKIFMLGICVGYSLDYILHNVFHAVGDFWVLFYILLYQLYLAQFVELSCNIYNNVTITSSLEEIKF